MLFMRKVALLFGQVLCGSLTLTYWGLFSQLFYFLLSNIYCSPTLFFQQFMNFVGLSNILDRERRKSFNRRKPKKRTHRDAVGAPLVGSELPTKIGKRIELVGRIEAFLVFSVTAFYFSVMPWRVRADKLMADI